LCRKINSSTLADKQLSKFIKQEQTSIIKQIEKKLKCQNYYRNLWLALGMTAFDYQLSCDWFKSWKYRTFIGLPIEWLLDLLLAQIWTKALIEERQLNIEIKN
jgi:hypothetical protein